jgi:hypothetical protein
MKAMMIENIKTYYPPKFKDHWLQFIKYVGLKSHLLNQINIKYLIKNGLNLFFN